MNQQFKEIKTPYFVIDKEELENLTNELKEAVQKYWSNTLLGYSFKTNSLPWVVGFFRDNGFYAEVVSDNEYTLAKAMHYEPNKIIYNGIIKSKETFLEALDQQCIVNIDSDREIEWLGEVNSEKIYSVGIRVNFDLEKACPNQTQCGNDGGRFGFCYENGELKRALDNIAQYSNVKVSGIHLHCSSKTRSLDIYKSIANMACQIKKEYNLTLDYIDVGGGFFGGLEHKPRFNDYLKCISEILSKEFDKDKTTLIVEPGMSLIGSPVSFVTSVIDIKTTTKNCFVITDGSRNNIDPLMTKSSYFFEIEYLHTNQGEVHCDKQVIAGYTCMEHDRLFELKNNVKLQVGDKIIYQKVGAYTMCLSPLFIKYFPDVYVKEKNMYKLIREKWSEKEYVQSSIGW